MASDSSGGLHYSGDVTVEITDPQLTFSNPHGQRVGPRWVRGEMVFAMLSPPVRSRFSIFVKLLGV